MRILLLAGLALVSACGSGNDSEAVDANAMVTDNLMLDANTTMDAGNMAANGTIDANTANMMVEDVTTNDPDTNLANGL